MVEVRDRRRQQRKTEAKRRNKKVKMSREGHTTVIKNINNESHTSYTSNTSDQQIQTQDTAGVHTVQIELKGNTVRLQVGEVHTTALIDSGATIFV